MMPVRSGYEVCRRIREQADWRHIKIIMRSAKRRVAEVINGLAIGADLCITKPFSTRDLMHRIGDLLATPVCPPPANGRGQAPACVGKLK